MKVYRWMWKKFFWAFNFCKKLYTLFLFIIIVAHYVIQKCICMRRTALKWGMPARVWSALQHHSCSSCGKKEELSNASKDMRRWKILHTAIISQGHFKMMTKMHQERERSDCACPTRKHVLMKNWEENFNNKRELEGDGKSCCERASFHERKFIKLNHSLRDARRVKMWNSCAPRFWKFHYCQYWKCCGDFQSDKRHKAIKLKKKTIRKGEKSKWI